MSRRVTTAVVLLIQLLGVSLAAQPRESAKKIPQLRKVLQESREKNDLLCEALTLLRLGVAEADLGNVDNARSNLTDAANKMRAQNDVLGTWMAHFALSHVETAVGRAWEAVAQIEKALVVMVDESNPELLSHLQPITHDVYGSVLTRTGRLEKAEEELSTASAGSKGRYDFSIAAHFGDLRFRQQRFDEARAHYQKAVSEFAAGSTVLLLDRRAVLVGVYDRLALPEIITGHPERARHWNGKVLEIATLLSYFVTPLSVHACDLVEDYPITYVPSASTIRFLREKDSPVGSTALVLGEPTTAKLPGAGREARTVAAKLHTTAKLGNEAQESELYGLNGKVDLVHIAAHGTYDADNPLFSAIQLAEGNKQNGQLNVDKIQSKLDLSGVNLVVLSACRSGMGKRSGGDEIIGLTRSILYAGSLGVIATLWDISDDATPPLIEKFYDHLLDGATAADALRAAQTEMLRDPKLAIQRFWAAFFLTGNPQGNWKRPSS